MRLHITTNYKWLTVYCFRLFPEITILKKLIIQSSVGMTAKPGNKQGRSEAPGSCAWHLLGTHRLAHVVPKLRLVGLWSHCCCAVDLSLLYAACAVCVQVQHACAHDAGSTTLRSDSWTLWIVGNTKDPVPSAREKSWWPARRAGLALILDFYLLAWWCLKGEMQCRLTCYCLEKGQYFLISPAAHSVDAISESVARKWWAG